MQNIPTLHEKGELMQELETWVLDLALPLIAV